MSAIFELDAAEKEIEILNSKIDVLENIARRSGAWKDKNGDWVCDPDEVFYWDESLQIEIKQRAGNIEHSLRKFYAKK